MSEFNPENFLGTNYDSKTDTRFASVPQGEYRGQITEVSARQFQGKDGRTWTVIDCMWEILDQDLQRRMEVDRPPRCQQESIFVDLTPGGQIDMGPHKSIALGRQREALRQNSQGNWSPRAMIGSMAKVVVEHQPNDRDPENPFARITRVSPL